MLQPSDEIKQKLDIVDVLREYIPLRPAGMNFRAKCPFHQEKTPSFMVSPDKQIWHCFGCDKGGDIFSFIQEIEGVDFVEALRILAPKAGVLLRRQDPALSSQRNRVLDCLELSRKYFHKMLIDSQAARSARDYLHQRGLSEDTIEEWQIGYSPDAWDETSKFLKQKGFKENELFLAGLVVKSDTSNRFYDRFRGRIMFPINDVNGNTAAFSARVSPHKEETEKMGKYINSPQTMVYDKSKILFGLDRAKLEIKKHDMAIIVEGQMDAISVYQAGYKNVVASSGTALTKDQIQILKRYSQNISLAFDMDEAGNLAVDRGIREAMQGEMILKVIELPTGQDPDECIRKNPDAWKLAVESAKPMMQYIFDHTLESLDLDAVNDQRQAANKLLPIIIQLGNKIEQDYWLKELSQRVQVGEGILRETIKNIQIPKNQDSPIVNQGNFSRSGEGSSSREERTGELMLVLILKYPFLLEYALKHLQVEQVIGSSINELYRNMLIYYNNTIKSDFVQDKPMIDYGDFHKWLLDSNNLNNDLKTDQLKLLDKLVFLGERDFFDTEEEQAKAEMIKIVKFLKKNYIVRRMREVERLLAESEKDQDSQQIEGLTQEFKSLSEEITELND